MNPKEYIPNYDLIAIGEWYKDGWFWRKKNTDESDGKGDLIFNTCYKILRDRDKSDWAYKAMQACANLLLKGQRWPERMWAPLDAESWIERIIVRSLKHWFGITVKRYEFRYQGRMVRDSWIALYTACVFLDRKQFIEAVSMPWYLYSPEVWRWRKRLIKDERIDYKRRLGFLRAKAVVMDQSEFE
jgi:hypothetical protein